MATEVVPESDAQRRAQTEEEKHGIQSKCYGPATDCGRTRPRPDPDDLDAHGRPEVGGEPLPLGHLAPLLGHGSAPLADDHPALQRSEVVDEQDALEVVDFVLEGA